MASNAGQIIATPLQSDDYGSFNWIFLVEYILCGILCLWFLFYFNRIFATLISYLIRLGTWHFFGVYIDIEALQISILAGRVFFKSIRYNGDNETVFVHGGYITWRYWLRKVKPCRLFHEKYGGTSPHTAFSARGRKSTTSDPDLTEEGKLAKKVDALPCRIDIRVSGVEAFLYNRSPAYDYILETCAKHDASRSTTDREAKETEHAEKTGDRTKFAGSKTNVEAASSSSSTSLSSGGQDTVRNATRVGDRSFSSKSNHTPPAPPAILRLLPVSVHCNKAAAVLGNENTPSIMTAKIDSASGEFDASESGPLDVFKILMQFSVKKPLIQIKPNIDYKRSQDVEASLLECSDAKVSTAIDRDQVKRNAHAVSEKQRSRRSTWKRLPGLSKRAMESLDSVTKFSEYLASNEHLPDARTNTSRGGRWLGLSRYLDDSQRSDADAWKDVEYAKASTLADLNAVDFMFYWDIAGPRPPRQSNENDQGQATTTLDVNGVSAPEYGMELFVYGGTVHYGPWADRHRVFMQQLFFPAPYADAAAVDRVRAGSTRLCTIFDLFLSIEADTVLRIPFREPSKDYKWKGRTETKTSYVANQTSHWRRRRNADKTVNSTHARPYAWFDICVKPDSTIKYKQDMYPTLHGYKNYLRVDIGGIDMHSSLNHALLWKSGKAKVDADLSNPLKWNGLHEWTFELGINDLDFFLLTDHAVLLMDMIEDWTNQPQPGYFTFVPYRYILKPKFERVKLFLNVNDANIVDQSDDIHENDFAILYGRELNAEVLIPIDRFRPPQNTISFDVLAHDLGFELSMPPKNTLNVFLEDKDVAQLPRLDLKGEYVLCSEVRADLCETLNMKIIGKGLVGAFYGFFGRHLAKIKENYFGEEVHFRTLQEYQELVRNGFQSNDPEAPIRGNDLDVILDITAEDAHILLPTGLYSCNEYVELMVDTADVDLRVNNYYLELMVDSSPLQLKHGSQATREGERVRQSSETQIAIDSINVYGHRLFGNPPSEPAYVSEWDIFAGDIIGQCTEQFVARLASAVQALALTLTDEENGLPIPMAVTIYDATVVRWRASLIRLWLNIAHEVFILNTHDIEGSFNDLATKQFSQNLIMRIPEVIVACADANPNAFERSAKSPDCTQAYLKTAVSLRMIQRSADFSTTQKGQKEHIARQDARTLRASFLSCNEKYRSGTKPAALCLPTLPRPLRNSPLTLSPNLNTSVATKIFPATIKSTSNSAQEASTYLSLQAVEGRSAFLQPRLPLDEMIINLEHVPKLPRSERPSPVVSGEEASLFNVVPDDDIVRTSVSIETDPGLVGFCTPKAILAASKIFEAISCKAPEATFDLFQIDVTSKVLTILKSRRGQHVIFDLGISVPFVHARVINRGIGERERHDRSTHVDEYNLSLTKASTAVRIKNASDRKHTDNLKAVHVTVSSISLSTKPQMRQANEDAVACEVRLSNTLLWLADSDRMVVNASFDEFEAKVASQELRYLAALIHRAASLGQDLALPFVNQIANNIQRRRFLVYSLVKAGQGLPDPSFLTRPSYMIRSAEDHLRNTDSWRIIARLRWVLHNLNQEQRSTLRGKCLADDVRIPEPIEKFVAGSMEQWRSWDAHHIKDSIAIRTLTGRPTDPVKPQDVDSIPLSVSVRGSRCKIGIDHRRKRNGVRIDNIAVAVSVLPPPPPSAMQMFQEYRQARLTTIHLSTAEATLDLNWELCSLADQIMTLFEEDVFLQKSAQLSEAAKPLDNRDENMNEELHLVLQMDSANALFEALNVAQTLSSRDFRISVLSKALGASSSSVSAVNIVTSAREASMRTKGAMHALVETKLQSSSLVVAFQKADQNVHQSNRLHVGGVADRFDLQILEEPASIIEIVGSIFKDEVSQVQSLVDRHRSTLQRDTKPPPTTASGPPLESFVTLVLGSYILGTPIVQDLCYRAQGDVLRLGVSPEPEQQSSHVIDFDLKAQGHTFWRGDAAEPLAKSVLELPSINGSIRLLLSPALTTMSTAISIERVKLQGLALYSLFSMFCSSGVLAAFQSLSDDAKSLIQVVDASLKPGSVSKSKGSDQPKKASTFIFDATLSLVGFTIVARTHKVREDEPQASVSFRMSSTHFRASNRSPEVAVALPFPEMRLALGQMDTVVERQARNLMRESARVLLAVDFACSVSRNLQGQFSRNFELVASGPSIQVDEYTGPILVNLLGHFQERLKSLDVSTERRYIRRLKDNPVFHTSSRKEELKQCSTGHEKEQISVATSLEFHLRAAHVTYMITRDRHQTSSTHQNLVFSLSRIDFNTKGEEEARLHIQDIKLQISPQSLAWDERSANSALLPEMIFTVKHESSTRDRRLLFRAAGKALDVQVHPNVVQPAARMEKSISASANRTRSAVATLRARPIADETSTPKATTMIKSLSLLIVDVSFAGAVIRLQEHDPYASSASQSGYKASRPMAEQSRYSNISSDSSNKNAALRAPGVAARVQYIEPEHEDPVLNVEIKIDKSRNVLTPTVVPLIMQMAHNVKETVDEKGANQDEKAIEKSERLPDERKFSVADTMFDESFFQQNPRALLGRTRLNIGMRINSQELALVCQPIAKVEARMKLEDSYMTVNTVHTPDADNFFAVSVTFTGMEASLQHVYSREATFKFEIVSITLSALNSRHTSGKTGISAILKINPMKAHLNAKQLQDVLLFREIWLPPEIRDSALQYSSAGLEEQQEYFVSKYRQIAASTAFPWNATIAIADLGLDLDLGQAIGKISSHVTNLWASSRKTTSSQQSLCVGMDSVNVDAYGRMSGSVSLNETKIRTSIAWPEATVEADQIPLVQGSVGFKELRVKAAFDYQIFAISHITSFEFIMYNVKDQRHKSGDRLVAILDGGKVHAYCVASSAALAVSLSQAFERLIQDKQASYEQSLKEIDSFLRRKLATSRPSVAERLSGSSDRAAKRSSKNKSCLPVSLHTDVMVTIGAMDVGAFPRTVMDQQILRLETSDVQARFAVALEGQKLHSGLGLTLGQVRAALSEVPQRGVPKPIGEVGIDDVVGNATSARGGTILRVPKVVATMQTWQSQNSRRIDYKFKSTFEGKIDVGWNYSRISFIRGMHATHTRTLATRLGKPLPESALKISGPQPLPEDEQQRFGEPDQGQRANEQSKITVTANVNLPNSGYEYHALEPAIIDTPQLRDMGEATPPLEWIGLHRDKLPNVTHQIVIVTLLEVAKEVEDTYTRILGSA